MAGESTASLAGCQDDAEMLVGGNGVLYLSALIRAS